MNLSKLIVPLTLWGRRPRGDRVIGPEESGETTKRSRGEIWNRVNRLESGEEKTDVVTKN